MPETGPQPGTATATIERDVAPEDGSSIEDDFDVSEQLDMPPINEFRVITEPDPDDFGFSGTEGESEPDNHISAEYDLRDGELYPSSSNEDDGTQAGLAISHYMDEEQRAEYQEAIAIAMEGGEGRIETRSPVGHTENTEQFVIMTYRFVRFKADGTPVVEISSDTIDRPLETPLLPEDQTEDDDYSSDAEEEDASFGEAAVAPVTETEAPSTEPDQSETTETTASSPEAAEADTSTNTTRAEYIMRDDALTPARAGDDGTDANLDMAHWMSAEQRALHEAALAHALSGGEGFMEMRGIIGHTDTEDVFVVATYRHLRNEANGAPVIEVTSTDVKRPVAAPPAEAGTLEPEAQHRDHDSDTTDEAMPAEPAVAAPNTPIQSETTPPRDAAETKAPEPGHAEAEAQLEPVKSEDEQDAATVAIQPTSTPAPPDAPGGGTLTPPAEQTPAVIEGQPDATETGDEAGDGAGVVQVSTAVSPAPVMQSETAAPSAEQATTQTVGTESTPNDSSDAAETDLPVQVAVAPATQTAQPATKNAPAPAAQSENARTAKTSPATTPTERTATYAENVEDAPDDENDAREAGATVQTVVAASSISAIQTTTAPSAPEQTITKTVPATEVSPSSTSQEIPAENSDDTTEVGTNPAHEDDSASETTLDHDVVYAGSFISAATSANQAPIAQTRPGPTISEQTFVMTDSKTENAADVDAPAQTEADTSKHIKAAKLAEPAATIDITPKLNATEPAPVASGKQDTETDTLNQIAASANPTPVIRNNIMPTNAEQIAEIPLDDRIDTTYATPIEADTPIVQSVVKSAVVYKDNDATFNETSVIDAVMTGTQTEVENDVVTPIQAAIPPAAETVIAAPSQSIAEKITAERAEIQTDKAQVEQSESNQTEDAPAEAGAAEPAKREATMATSPIAVEADWLADFGAAPGDAADGSWRDELEQPRLVARPAPEAARNLTTAAIGDDADEDDIVISFDAKPTPGRTRRRHKAGSVAA